MPHNNTLCEPELAVSRARPIAGNFPDAFASAFDTVIEPDRYKMSPGTIDTPYVYSRANPDHDWLSGVASVNWFFALVFSVRTPRSLISPSPASTSDLMRTPTHT